MATKEFKREGYKYTPEREVINNGTPGRIWNRWELRENAWIYKGALFIPHGYTKSQIIESFKDYQNW